MNNLSHVSNYLFCALLAPCRLFPFPYHRLEYHVCKNSCFWSTRPGSRLTIVLRALTASTSFFLAVRIIRGHHRDSTGVVLNPRIGVEDKRRFTQRTYVLFLRTRMGIRPAPSRVEIRREDVKRPSTAPGRAADSPSRGLAKTRRRLKVT